MSDRLYLFRYRDLLTEDTLREHRDIIRDHEHCWWGWWQRPGESVRGEVWDDLCERVATEPVKIGLFNSDPKKTSDQIHWAVLDRVIAPREDGLAPKIPDGEAELVPEYYRKTPFSSAWMRLTAIDAEAKSSFFGQYSFARAPSLRGIAEKQREKFIDKIVLDADELRAMDTTIWAVRPSRDGDRSERILTASVRVTEALSNRPVPLKATRILHLSDLHFAKENRREHRWQFVNEGPNTLHQRILSALGDQPNVGLVVISGDIADRAEPEEFYEAFRFVHGLLGALRLGPEHLVIVPGNHDIAWSRDEDEAWDGESKPEEADGAAMDSYRKHYGRVFRHDASPRLGMARRFVLPSGLTLEVGGLNSSGLRYGAQWLAGMGRLPDGAFEEIKGALGWSGRPSVALRMLVHHHHLTVTEDVLPANEFYRGFGMSVDAKQTLRQAARHGVQLVLHGHRHQPFLSFEQVYSELEHTEEQYSLGRVGIVGGGSAGSISVSDDANFFNVLDLGADGVTLQIYRSRSPEGRRGTFRVMKEFFAPFTLESGRLALGIWNSLPKANKT